MSPRTATLPPTEPLMWRKLLAKVHPDAGGDHETFIWALHVRAAVCNGATVPPPKEGARPQPPPPPKSSSGANPDRIPFDTSSASSFSELTTKALALADIGDVLPLYTDLLRLLADCEEVHAGTHHDQQKRGASYKQLAAIGHKVGMSKERRIEWYRLVERIPLSMRHAGHILKKFSERGV